MTGDSGTGRLGRKVLCWQSPWVAGLPAPWTFCKLAYYSDGTYRWRLPAACSDERRLTEAPAFTFLALRCTSLSLVQRRPFTTGKPEAGLLERVSAGMRIVFRRRCGRFHEVCGFAPIRAARQGPVQTS